MKKSKFTEQQISVQQAEGGTQVAEVCRKMGTLRRLSPSFQWLCGSVERTSSLARRPIGSPLDQMRDAGKSRRL